MTRQPACRLLARTSGPLAALLGVAAFGCGGPPDEGELPDDGVSTAISVESFVPRGESGELRLDQGIIHFRACTDDEFRTFEDGTGGEILEIPDRLGPADRPLGAHLVLDGDRIIEVRSVFPEGSGCPDVLPDTELQARGNEPFWGVDVDGETATFRSPEDIDGIEYSEGEWDEVAAESGESEWRFRALRDFTDGIMYLTVGVRQERCYDTMSGAWYPFTAQVSEGGEEYEGCALEGRRAHR